MLFIHGVPIEYTGLRKADQLVRNLKKFVAPDVSILESDSAIKNFVENAGMSFPIFIGFGVNESLIGEYGGRYKKRASFAAAKDYSEDVMVAYDFDKVPALVAIHPKYKEQSLFYGPFEGTYVTLYCVNESYFCVINEVICSAIYNLISPSLLLYYTFGHHY
jgi:protein disulfide-isomerase A1